MNAKTSLIAGAIILLLFACFLTELVVSVAGNARAFQPPIISDPSSWNLLGLLAVLVIVSIVALTAWLIMRGNETAQRLNEKLTIRANIPGYFLVALLPIGLGLGIMVVTYRMEMGCFVSLLSIPSILIFLLIALRQSNSSLH
jgi:H+/Cl- antiporter ClcA